MSAPPYMKLYVADYLGDTHHLGALEHGAYLLLLMAMWRAGGVLPVADANLAKLARCTPDQWAEIRDVVLPFFKRSRGRLTHKRLTAELAKYENTSGKRSEAGKKGAAEKASRNNGDGAAKASDAASNSRHNQNQNQKKSSVDKSTGDEAAELPFDPDAETWNLGVRLLREQGRATAGAARGFIGKLLKDRPGLTAKDLLPAITGALSNKTQEPQAYLTRAADGIAQRRTQGAEPRRVGFV